MSRPTPEEIAAAQAVLAAADAPDTATPEASAAAPAADPALTREPTTEHENILATAASFLNQTQHLVEEVYTAWNSLAHIGSLTHLRSLAETLLVSRLAK